MSIKTFNQAHIRKVTDIGLQNTINILWQWKAKEGIEIVQRAINTLGADIEVDGWLGSKTISALDSIGSNMAHGALAFELSKLEESQDPHYLTIARRELGVKEIKGRKHNEHILKYHATSYGRYKNDEVPWCGSFVNWVMQEAGYLKTVRYPERAKAWRKFGKAVSEPTHGCIAIKSRSGGGHVCFVVGQSKKGKYLYCLGGNQGDAVTIRKYKKNVFSDFRIPKNQEAIALSVYTGEVARGNREA